MNAKISEVFMSLQGEGPYTGAKQLFIRFHGCSFGCRFCDTKPSSYENFTEDSLLAKVLEYKEPYHSVSITGGEPLEQAEFLKSFLRRLKEEVKATVYLETNGIGHDKLEDIIDFTDIISMDFKLPSATGRDAVWNEHAKFLSIAGAKEVFVKIVVSDTTRLEDIDRAKKLISEAGHDIPVILQPADPVNGMGDPDWAFLTEAVKGFGDKARLMIQYQKIWGMK